MNFAEFCEDAKGQDGQKVTAGESLLVKFGNSAGKEFSLEADGIREFMVALRDDHQGLEEAWGTPKKNEKEDTKPKGEFSQYEEKPYRRLYKHLPDNDRLKEFNSVATSQSKAVTQVIAKIICFLTEQRYEDVAKYTGFDRESVQRALERWEENFAETLRLPEKPECPNPDGVRKRFFDWLVNVESLAEKTATSYSGAGIGKCEEHARQAELLSKPVYAILDASEIDSLTEQLKGMDRFAEQDRNGNKMYSSSLQQYSRFLSWRSSLQPLSKPFMLLAGISGTGKTRFVREQARASGDGRSNYCIVPVRPDWHEPSDLLGYISRLGGSPKFVATDVVRFLVRAWKAIQPEVSEENGRLFWKRTAGADPEPYWLCLDEMNLAPVEQYFADYLSVMESREWVDRGGQRLYCCEPLLRAETLGQAAEKSRDDLLKELGLDPEDGSDSALGNTFLEFGIAIPYNVIVAGTVNMDETTHGFSRKVIDRAVTVDFGQFYPNEFGNFFSAQQDRPVTLTYPVISHVREKEMLGGTVDHDGLRTVAFLSAVNDALRGTPFELAYRSLNEILLSVLACQPREERALFAAWDDFIMTKVLPRIEGDREKLAPRVVLPAGAGREPQSVLGELQAKLKEQLKMIWHDGPSRPDLMRKVQPRDGGETPGQDIPCRSKLKIEWMDRRLKDAGYTSFWP